jgi:hypothetical protein
VQFPYIKEKLTDNHQQITDFLMTTFFTIVGKINNKIKRDYCKEFDTGKHWSYLSQAFLTPFPEIKFEPMSTKETENIIKSLKPKNSNGYDEISVNILKISASAISSPLAYICNKSFSMGVFPTHLKYSEIIPLLKNGDKTSVMNYRPISLLTSFSKVIEKDIFVRLPSHIKNNNILSNQYGFRGDSSSDRAIYNFINEILKALDDNVL